MPGPIVAATSGSGGMSFAGIAMLIFAAMFVGFFVYVGVREWRAMRRERQPVHAADPHTVHLADLGPTMADGGEPEPEDTETGRR
ncbi:MAG: hypothetical protein EP329_03305 [Deltaproteobacteria bacterium]|nr:MAG: hypothetical protein EP329_03305 [Deltaproteobacteria bacterium]